VRDLLAAQKGKLEEPASKGFMAIGAEEISRTRRRLILHDSLAFLSLVLITVVLFTATLFLFRSFQAHRAELATRWSDRGLTALQAGRPEEAIAAYRTALLYSPDERPYELKLAQALGEAGRIEEAYNYFTGLWEMQPGDGFINLHLARLAAKKNETQDAVNFYRASVYGTWEGDGVERRREVRLELARYLIAQHEPGQARTELLVAGGNAPDTPAIDLALAKLLEQAGASTDALSFYRKALAHDPKNAAALSSAGRLAFAMAEYGTAYKFFERSMRDRTEAGKNGEDETLLAQSNRILQLMPFDSLPARERVERILAARTIAKARLTACASRLGAAGPLPPSFEATTSRWTDGDAKTNMAINASDLQTATLQLVYDTEIETNQVCGAPTGDDALLLLLAKSSGQDRAPGNGR